MRKPNLLCTLIILGGLAFFPPTRANAHNTEIIAAKTTTAITMDGNEGGQYGGIGNTITVMAPIAVTIKLKTFHDPATQQESIFLLVTVTDTSANGANDIVDIWLDMLHDGGPTTDDIGFRVKRSGQLNKLTGSAGAPVELVGWVPSMANQVVLSGAPPANTWQFEVQIKADANDLAVAFLPSVMGLFVHVIDTPTGGGSPTEVAFPDPLGDTNFPSNLWADLKTRLPIEVMMVLDQSGSMLSLTRWDSAKKAANVLANTLFTLKSTEFADKLGMVTFKTDCSTAADITNVPKDLAAFGIAFPGDYVAGTPDPLPNNCTPIIKGLVKAFEGNPADVTLKVVSEPNRQTERVVLLLSDGFHNSPPANIPALPAQTGYDPCPLPADQTNPGNPWSPCNANIVPRVTVNTVALGSDANVDTGLLTDIKNRYRGAMFGSIYNIADVGEADLLKEFFVNAFDDFFQVNTIPLVGNEFTLNTSERKLIVILSFNTVADARAISLERKPNPMGAFAPVACTTSAVESTAAGFSICTVNSPQSGIYRASAPGAPSGPDRQFNLVDLNLAATFAIDKQLHGTGQDLVLSARLNEAGAPVTNTAAHPVKVTVNIKRPTEGFGTYVSTHEPPSCDPKPPQLPPVGRDPQSPTAGGGPGVPPFVAVAGNEPKPARFAKIDSLFAACGKSSLSVTDEPGTDMFDDGTHGDATANDGIYTLRIQNAQTQFEGSYIFRFRATGKSPKGDDFARSKTMAEYVRVNVDPGATPIDSRVVTQVGTVVTAEYSVTPRDRFGGYLGPGHSDQITFSTTAGAFVTPIIDYNNGIYSRILRFDNASENPVVGGTVQGQPLQPASGFGGGQGFEFFPYIGGTFYQNSLNLNHGFTAGARFGYRFPNQIALEAEGGVTFTRFNAGPLIGRRAKLIQVLGNVRYDIDQWSNGNWTPYVIGGVGGIFSRSSGVNDSTFAVHGGFGSTFRLTNHVGLRFDGRVFRYGTLNGAPSTTNFQINGGVVFRF